MDIMYICGLGQAANFAACQMSQTVLCKLFGWFSLRDFPVANGRRSYEPGKSTELLPE